MNNKFNVKTLTAETRKLAVAALFTNWQRVVSILDNAGFNVFEAEAILTSELIRRAVTLYGNKRDVPQSSGVLEKYLRHHEITPGCDMVNKMVMEKFAKEYSLELNDKGQPCRRGSMPGNPKGGTILVPLGTPISCDPTSETYWCM